MIKKYKVKEEDVKRIYPEQIPLLHSSLKIYDARQSSSLEEWYVSPGVSEVELNKVDTEEDGVFLSKILGFYEIRKAIGRLDRRYLLLPTETVQQYEEPSLADKYKHILDKMMPGRYFIRHMDTHSEVFLYYPEFTIKNSIEETHKIKDFVVQINLTSDGVVPQIWGKRFSFTNKALRIGYSHSHLTKDSHLESHFMPFCQGGDSKVKRYIETLGRGCSEIQFETLIVQIEHYLTWESIEGRPHISISSLYINGGSAIQGSYTIHSETEKYAIEIIKRLTPDLLRDIDGRGTTYMLDMSTPAKSKKMLEIELDIASKVSGHDIARGNIRLFDYNIESGTYMDAGDSSRRSLSAGTTTSETKDIREAFNITPHIYEENPQTEVKPTVKRLAQNDVMHLFKRVNQILLDSHKLNEEVNIPAQS